MALMKTLGRPSTYLLELADEICERIATGEPLRAICRDEHMPAWRTVYDWLRAHEDFSTRFAQARDVGFDAIAEQCLDIADDEQHDWLTTKKGPVTNEVAIGRARLQVDTRLKLLAKWSPKRYGDKQAVELSGSLALTELSDDDIRAELAALVSAGVVTPAALGEPADDDFSDLV